MQTGAGAHHQLEATVGAAGDVAADEVGVVGLVPAAGRDAAGDHDVAEARRVALDLALVEVCDVEVGPVRNVAVGPQGVLPGREAHPVDRSEEHTSEIQSLMRISYAVFCLKKIRLYERVLGDNKYTH